MVHINWSKLMKYDTFYNVRRKMEKKTTNFVHVNFEKIADICIGLIVFFGTINIIQMIGERL